MYAMWVVSFLQEGHVGEVEDCEGGEDTRPMEIGELNEHLLQIRI